MNAPSIHLTRDHGIIAHHAGASFTWNRPGGAGRRCRSVGRRAIAGLAFPVGVDLEVFELNLLLGSTRPQVRGEGVRFNPIHRMTKG
jgi:hypothetical protein